MLKEEFLKTFKSKGSLLIFIYLTTVAVGDNICGIIQAKSGSYYNAHPTFISLLSGQSAIVFYALFVWILPITSILLYGSRYSKECKSRMNYVYLVKSGRKKYFLSKVCCSFIINVIYFGIPLLLNLFVNIVFLHGGTSFCGFESFEACDFALGGKFTYFCINNPYIGWFIYYFIAVFVFGLAGVMSQCIAMMSKDNKITLAVSFAIWITFFSIKYDLTMAIQPFTEYGLSYMVKALLPFLIFVLASFVVAYVVLVVKKDEI